jgi:hypothetical protein
MSTGGRGKLRCVCCGYTDNIGRFREILDVCFPVIYRCPKVGCHGLATPVVRQGPTPWALKYRKNRKAQP